MAIRNKATDLFYKIIIACLFPMLIIAMIIALTGFKGPIQLDNTYYSFLQRAAIEASSWNIKIPSIPTIDTGTNTDEGFNILKVLVDFVNFFINFMNVIILVLNLVISLFTTIAAIIKLLLSFKDMNYSSNGELSWWVDTSSALIINKIC